MEQREREIHSHFTNRQTNKQINTVNGFLILFSMRRNNFSLACIFFTIAALFQMIFKPYTPWSICIYFVLYLFFLFYFLHPLNARGNCIHTLQSSDLFIVYQKKNRANYFIHFSLFTSFKSG